MKMRLPKGLRLAMLAILAVIGTSHAASDSYNFKDYDTFNHSVSSDKDVVITIGNGDYSAFDMYSYTSASNKSSDDGIIIGSAANNDNPVNRDPKNNDTAKSVSVTLNGGTGIKYILGIGSISCSVTGKIDITVNSGEVDSIVGGYMYDSKLNASTSSTLYPYPDKSEGNNVTITVNGGTVGTIYGGHRFVKNNPTTLKPFNTATEEQKEALLAEKPWAIGGDIKIVVTGGTVGAINAVGTPKTSASGNTYVEVSGGTVTGGILAGPSGEYSEVKGNTTVLISNDAVVKGVVYTGGSNGTIGGDVELTIKDNALVQGDVYAAGTGTNVKGNVTVYLQDNATIDGQLYGNAVKGGAVGKETILYIGTDAKGYTGSVGGFGNFDHVVVHEKSNFTISEGNIFNISHSTYRIASSNLTNAATKLGSNATVDINGPISVNIIKAENLRSGRYMLIDATSAVVDTTNWDIDYVSISGADFYDLTWQDNILYFVYKGAEVESILNNNWGVFKSSQAFTGTLWGNRTNACVLSPTVQLPCIDGKGDCISAAAPTGATLVWGTAYGQSARIEGAGADYSLYGGAMGIEHHFVSGRSIGTATGYDWGTVSPFGGKDVDQETWHIALYGRAATWAIGQNSSIAVDLNASYGKTTSETDIVTGEWKQDTIQMDARVSYFRNLNEQVTGSIFAGAQYFAADSADVAGMKVCSMQNLRTEGGVGVSYKASQKAAIYAEASIYNDAMRHNPSLISGGYRFTGTNPGRLGGSISVGAQYDLNDNWSVRGSYSFDAADDSTEHNLNAGAVYKF